MTRTTCGVIVLLLTALGVAWTDAEAAGAGRDGIDRRGGDRSKAMSPERLLRAQERLLSLKEGGASPAGVAGYVTVAVASGAPREALTPERARPAVVATLSAALIEKRDEPVGRGAVFARGMDCGIPPEELLEEIGGRQRLFPEPDAEGQRVRLIAERARVRHRGIDRELPAAAGWLSQRVPSDAARETLQSVAEDPSALDHAQLAAVRALAGDLPGRSDAIFLEIGGDARHGERVRRAALARYRPLRVAPEEWKQLSRLLLSEDIEPAMAQPVVAAVRRVPPESQTNPTLQEIFLLAPSSEVRGELMMAMPLSGAFDDTEETREAIRRMALDPSWDAMVRLNAIGRYASLVSEREHVQLIEECLRQERQTGLQGHLLHLVGKRRDYHVHEGLVLAVERLRSSPDAEIRQAARDALSAFADARKAVAAYEAFARGGRSR